MGTLLPIMNNLLGFKYLHAAVESSKSVSYFSWHASLQCGKCLGAFFVSTASKSELERPRKHLPKRRHFHGQGLSLMTLIPDFRLYGKMVIQLYGLGLKCSANSITIYTIWKWEIANEAGPYHAYCELQPYFRASNKHAANLIVF